MKFVTIVGARPQFIKAMPVSKVLREAGHSEFLLHTGQHYDFGMSQVFFDELGIPFPDMNLGVGSGLHGWQTGQMLSRIEQVLLKQQPNWVLVFGDTNSTLAGALAACKLHIPIAHVEAGLRSNNRTMPEEHNRVLADHCSDILFCPTQTAMDNLTKEGLAGKAYQVGDTMCDAVQQFAEIARHRSTILPALGLAAKKYLLATLHRPYNTDTPQNLRNLFRAFEVIDETIVFPVHPRTRTKILEMVEQISDVVSPNVKLIDPIGYLDMLTLEQNARLILTDSGGIQKEAYIFGIPCLTLRPETEWVETVQAGWNRLVRLSVDSLVDNVRTFRPPAQHPGLFGDGQASRRIAGILRDDPHD